MKEEQKSNVTVDNVYAKYWESGVLNPGVVFLITEAFLHFLAPAGALTLRAIINS